MKKIIYLNLKKYTPFILIASIGLLGILSIPIKAQYVPWTQKADMETGRQSVVANAVDGKIYVIGGRYTETLVSEYDPASDTWTIKDSMPTFREIPSGAAVNGKIYIMGGIPVPFLPALTTVEEYDPVTDTWTTKTPMLTPRGSHCTSVVDGKIYIIGGMTSGPSFWEGMRDTVEIYDPVTDSWSIGASMPTERVFFTTSVVDGKIYAIGGDLVTMEDISTVEMYDPTTDTWTTKSPMPTARAGHVAAVVDGIIYVIGGGTHSANPPAFSTVEAYDPATDTWTTKSDLPEEIALACADKIDGNIYIFGGISSFADPHLEGTKTVYKYDPSIDLAEVVNTLYINKCFAEAGNDSICITTILNDTTGIQLFANIEAPDQVSVDSIQLFDDGVHNDGEAGDSIYANIWNISLTDEQQYYVDLHVTREAEDTVIYWMDNMVSFTTIGPLVFDSHSFEGTDAIPNPGDNFEFNVLLRNNGTTATAPNLKAKIVSEDPLVNIKVNQRTYPDIAPGETTKSDYSYLIEISEDCPANTEISFRIDIASNNYYFWSDTFSIQVEEPTVNSIDSHSQHLPLIQNYPNPFNQTTTIEFTLPEETYITLKIYDSYGKEISTLIDNEVVDSVPYSVEFNAGHYPPGVYYCQLQGSSFIVTRKMIITR